MDEDTESLDNVDVRLYGFFCRSCKKEIEFGQATCSCGKNVVTGLPWSVVVVLGILIAAIAYPTMIAIWLYALKNLISEFIPRAAMAIIISTAILGPVFVVLVPLAKAARVVVAPLGPNRTHCTRLRIVNDLWNCKKEPHFEDLIDDIREVDRVPFLVSLNPESRTQFFSDVLAKVTWATVASCDTRDKDTRVVRAIMNALVSIGEPKLVADIKHTLSDRLSGDELELATEALTNQEHRITEG